MQNNNNNNNCKTSFFNEIFCNIRSNKNSIRLGRWGRENDETERPTALRSIELMQHFFLQAFGKKKKKGGEREKENLHFQNICVYHDLCIFDLKKDNF